MYRHILQQCLCNIFCENNAYLLNSELSLCSVVLTRILLLCNIFLLARPVFLVSLSNFVLEFNWPICNMKINITKNLALEQKSFNLESFVIQRSFALRSSLKSELMYNFGIETMYI